MKYLFIIACCFFLQQANAQFGKDLLNKAKESAKRKAEQKVDQKIDATVGAGVDKADSVLTGKKKKKDKKNTKNTADQSEIDTNNNPVGSNEPTGGKINENGELIIKTNIKCAAGKTQIENLLRDTDGVNSVSIDTDSGKLYLSSADSNIYNIVTELIRKNGFEADGKKSTNPKGNPCN